MGVNTAAVVMAGILAGTCFQGMVIMVVSLRAFAGDAVARADAAIVALVLGVVLITVFVGLVISGLSFTPLTVCGGMAAGAVAVELPWLLHERKRATPAPDADLVQQPEDSAGLLARIPEGSEKPGDRSLFARTDDGLDVSIRWEPGTSGDLTSVRVELDGPVAQVANVMLMLRERGRFIHLARTSDDGRAEFLVREIDGARLTVPAQRLIGPIPVHLIPSEDLVLAADTVRREPRRTVVLGGVNVSLLEVQGARSGQRELEVSAESQNAADDGLWIVLQVAHRDDTFETLVLPLAWNPSLRRAFGSLKLGPATGGLRWAVAPEPLRGVSTVEAEILQRSALKASDAWTQAAFRRALGESS